MDWEDLREVCVNYGENDKFYGQQLCKWSSILLPIIKDELDEWLQNKILNSILVITNSSGEGKLLINWQGPSRPLHFNN